MARYALRIFLVTFVTVTIIMLVLLGPPQITNSLVHFVFRSAETMSGDSEQNSPVASPSPAVSPGLTPVTMIISKLNIQTSVEVVGLTETNYMDTPKQAANVGWYMHGPKPSEKGTAVIAGHYDTPSGRPAIFYKLDSLEAGDEVEVISENAVRSIFVVQKKSLIPYEGFLKKTVFAETDGKTLNLITCDGIWDPKKKSYTDRLVIHTILKE